MKVFAISDLHLSFSVAKPMEKFGKVWEGQTDKLSAACKRLVGKDDLLLMAGDISWALRESEAICDLEYLGGLEGNKVLIRGNHDYWWSTISKVRRLLPSGVFAVHNDALRFGNVVVGGNRGVVSLERGTSSPKGVELELYKKHYERELARFDLSIKAMKDIEREGDRLVLMTHYPPYNSLRDYSLFMEKFEAAGISDVVFGHIHHTASWRGKGAGLDYCKDGVNYWLTSSDILSHTPILIYDSDAERF